MVCPLFESPRNTRKVASAIGDLRLFFSTAAP
jgi:hypothetical protein